MATYDRLVTLDLLEAGLTLTAQLKDTDGNDVGSLLTTGYVDLGGGNYSWLLTQDTTFLGVWFFTDVTNGGTYTVAVNPSNAPPSPTPSEGVVSASVGGFSLPMFWGEARTFLVQIDPAQDLTAVPMVFRVADQTGVNAVLEREVTGDSSGVVTVPIFTADTDGGALDSSSRSTRRWACNIVRTDTGQVLAAGVLPITDVVRAKPVMMGHVMTSVDGRRWVGTDGTSELTSVD